MMMLDSILRKFPSGPGYFDKDGFATSDSIADLLVLITTGISWKIEAAAKALRDMEQGRLVSSDGSAVPELEVLLGHALCSSLKKVPERPDWELQNAFRWVTEWQRSLEEAAKNENWTRVCPTTLIPAKDGDSGPFLLRGSDILSWLQRTSVPSICDAFRDELRRSGAPSLMVTPENEIDGTGPKESAGEQSACDSKESGAASHPKPSETPEERGDRLLKMYEEKKAAGVRAYLKEVADEEEIEVSTLKPILQKAKARRDKQ